MSRGRNIVHLDPARLRAYLQRHPEADYLLIDVRQPGEYTAAHIPGAWLMPLMQLEARLFELPPDRDLVFYCHSGGRSAAAAVLALDAEVTRKTIYNLSGGILAWDGMTLADYPRTAVFDGAATTEDLLAKAMDLEKGAWNFYQAVCRHFADAPWIEAFADLTADEVAHARSVYRLLTAIRTLSEPFEPFFHRLSGTILEGGLDLQAAVERIGAIAPDQSRPLFELALAIEAAAYDLYSTVAERDGTPQEARAPLRSIAQAEKAHIRRLVQAMEQSLQG